MISYIKGLILNISTKYLIVLVNNIGYKVFLKNEILLSSNVGKEVEFYIYQNIKEDSMDLFGFVTIEELEMFEKLISVSGIGPKSALGILTAVKVDEINNAIIMQDPNRLTKVAGVGKKTAERLVLELKGKTDTNLRFESGDVVSDDMQILEVLQNLGYALNESREAIKKIDPSIDNIDDKIKFALKALAK